MALTTYQRLRGVLAGVGHAGARILEDTAHLRKMADFIPAGPGRQLYDTLLKSIDMQAEQLKAVDE